jgi:hypothetical protein
MSLADVIKDALAVADNLLESEEILEPITVSRWTGQSVEGDPTYAADITPPAIVELKQQLRKDINTGVEVMSKTKLTIVRPIANQGTAGRREPIDPRDKITLPDGTTGPIIDIGGLVSGGTGKPYMLEVWLG